MIAGEVNRVTGLHHQHLDTQKKYMKDYMGPFKNIKGKWVLMAMKTDVTSMVSSNKLSDFNHKQILYYCREVYKRGILLDRKSPDDDTGSFKYTIFINYTDIINRENIESFEILGEGGKKIV